MHSKSPPTITHDDSIWDVEHQCYVMSNKSIMAFAQLCFENSDAAGMEALLMELGGVQYDEACTQKVVDLVLTQDAVDIANSCFSEQDIKDWSNDNTVHLIGKCPKLFAEWTAREAVRVRAISDFFSKSDDSEKCNMLEGRDLSLPAQDLYTLLKNDASLWREFPVSWIGEKSTVLRAAASAAGWTPEMLPSMFRGRAWEVKTWSKVFDYPWALCLANDAVAVLDYDERKAIGHDVANHPGRLVSRSAFMPPLPIQFSADTYSVDVALAEIITQRVPMGYVLEKNSNVVEVSLAVREQLTHIVDVHLALGCLNLLVDALCRDTLPGFQEKINSEIELPALDSPTH